MSVDYIDYEDIYDNIDDYEYPYNHINIKIIYLFLIKKNIINILIFILFSK